MAAEAARPWRVQQMEAREKEKILSSLRSKFHELFMAANYLSGTSEPEREAKAQAKEDIESVVREMVRVNSQIEEPDYSSMTEAERAAEAERLRQEELEEARRLKLEGSPNGLVRESEARIMDFDPKQGGMYFNRLLLNYIADSSTFDRDEESPFGPMRFTNKVYENGTADTCEAINILSVKVASSDVGFPIQVYGSVIARDSIDLKCVYLFRCDRDHCQLISSKDEQLILTGPKRGLALLGDSYVETDLKIKDHHGQDRELSKGILTIRGIAHRRMEKCEIERKSIATRLSTVDVIYAVVKGAVEGTIAVRVLEGEFHGTITAHTTSIQKRIVLYDSKEAAAKTRNRHGVLKLLRSVVSVYVMDMLVIDAKTSAGEYAHLELTPRVNGGARVVMTIGATKMRVRVAWSIMDP